MLYVWQPFLTLTERVCSFSFLKQSCKNIMFIFQDDIVRIHQEIN